MAQREEDNLFAGRIGEEYRMLELISPNAASLARRVGAYVGGWRAGERLEGLEIGCGNGVSTLPLLAGRENLRLTAIDSSATMLEQARTDLDEWVAAKRVEFVAADALAWLESAADASLDVVASNYAIHNFRDDYRRRAHAEIFRVLKPHGLFVNGDRYALDDREEHLALTQAEARRWFGKFAEIGRYDLLEDWIVHLFGDESPERVMYLTPALEHLSALGFSPVRVEYRDGVDALVAAIKP